MTDRANDAPPRDGEPTLDDFWAFRTMLTPLLVQVIFWIGVLACVAVGAYHIIQARSGDAWNRIEVLRGIAWIVFGPLAVRLVCEVVILFFRMNETLTEIRNKLK
jgi:hypothetical protein